MFQLKKCDSSVWPYFNEDTSSPSFNIVEGEEWQAMISKFDPRYQFSILHKISSKVVFTSDLWTASNGTSFLSLTIHYINSFWKLKHFLLDIILIKEANVIMDVLDKYGISEKTLALIMDNASSIILCGTIIAEELESFNDLTFLIIVGSGLDFIDESIKRMESPLIMIAADDLI
ncbi:26462_t:CDS:2, partial [Gigaspora margarita]